jgi:hypothetical protein
LFPERKEMEQHGMNSLSIYICMINFTGDQEINIREGERGGERGGAGGEVVK